MRCGHHGPSAYSNADRCEILHDRRGGAPGERREGGRNQGLRGKEGKKIRETKLVC